MLPFLRSKVGYTYIGEDEFEDEPKSDSPTHRRRSHLTITIGPASTLLLSLLFISSLISTWLLFFKSIKSTSPSSQLEEVAAATTGPAWICHRPTTRREWRTLSEQEKLEYTAAVQCLATKPSELRNDGTLYDDFAWVHKDRASYTHASAPFLPWHRQYVYLYEKALREKCGLSFAIPYWDWSLDSLNFLASPIWDPNHGLGGNGTGSDSVGDGRCVTSGPFSELKPRFFDGEVQPHCLSRGFPKGDELLKLGELIQPGAIEGLLEENEYEVFAGEIERRAHKFLSHSVRGDLSRFTGPNDPVFWLHHVNLDRLWFEWQQRKPDERHLAYAGKADNESEAAASLQDRLDLGGLSKALVVEDVMDTDSGHFCYRY